MKEDKFYLSIANKIEINLDNTTAIIGDFVAIDNCQLIELDNNKELHYSKQSKDILYTINEYYI